MNLVPALKWFHNWVGFFVSIAMLIALTSGVYLGSVDIIKRLNDHGQEYQPLSIAQKANTVETLFARYPEMSTVRFPTEHTPFVQAATRGKSIVFDNDLNELAIRQSSDIPMFSTIFWLHRHFLMGDFGKYLNAWASLTGGVITLIGVYLWWRVRKGFRFKQTLPKNTRSSSLLKSHIQLGLFISIPLFILCISGFLITYKGLWISALKQQSIDDISYPVSQSSNWLSQLSTAQNLWPDSQLVAVSKPRVNPKEKALPTELNYSIGFDSHSDVWLREADKITMNFEQGVIQSALKHRDRPLSGRIASFVRPLHDALNMPLSYVILITFVSTIGAIIFLFTLVTFYRRTFKKKTTAKR
ncbi:PepSY-associated TM helix domain-containing protein [Shewanella psychrotolerans]|uniref:PepSY-associated TM helix domain-containing protein n=1 Tax=Shewanella psychrotolerans TaxID=2864206 RepID=UPI001C661EFD|nr:PepSY-associated TM helix domain-containing protein [Shewanella psychrotolerans]QYK02229.1 PepSY domain-containing protein [Shewanella psychrotolerans]